MTPILSSMIALSFGWLAFHLFTILEHESLRTKWLGQFRGEKKELPWFFRILTKKRRLAAIRLQLPLIMDLLAISVQAGIDLIQAIQKIVSHLPKSELLYELEKILEDLKLGRTRKEALQNFKERIPLIEIAQFISLLIQTIQLGSPLGPVLLANAQQMRESRLREVERLGMKAAIKILFPLIFFILPSVFLLIFAPLGIRYLTGGMANIL